MDRFSHFLNQTTGLELWMASLLVIALLTIGVNQLAQMLLTQASHLANKTDTVWDNALVDSARRPLLVALWVVGLGFMARVVQGQSEVAFLDIALDGRAVALIACVAWFFLRFVGQVTRAIEARQAARNEEFDRTTVDALGKLAKLVVLVVAVITVAQTLGFQIGGLLALGGVGGIAVGLAAKDLLANFFGGLTIYLDRPFSVGEWIRSPDKNIEGTVEYISWRHTRIRGFNKNPIYVPNSIFTNIVVENPSRMSHRRLREIIGLRYDDFDKVAPIVADIRALLQGHPQIDPGQSLLVNFLQYGPSSLDILVNAFTTTTDAVSFHAMKQDILLEIGRIIAGHGAEIAFPTQTVQLQGLPARGNEP